MTVIFAAPQLFRTFFLLAGPSTLGLALKWCDSASCYNRVSPGPKSKKELPKRRRSNKCIANLWPQRLTRLRMNQATSPFESQDWGSKKHCTIRHLASTMNMIEAWTHQICAMADTETMNRAVMTVVFIHTWIWETRIGKRYIVSNAWAKLCPWRFPAEYNTVVWSDNEKLNRCK